MRGKRQGLPAFLFLALFACSRSSPSAGAGDAAPAVSVSASAAAAIDPREDELWRRASDGEGDDLARLVDYAGCAGVEERGRNDAALRATAARAMAYCHDFSGLPWLAEVGQDGPDADALAALDSAVQLAAQPRRAVDPDDAPELREGCDRLMALARDVARPRDRRILAIRALRMFSERGCADDGAIPTDLDAR
jgi:hypothetical protein